MKNLVSVVIAAYNAEKYIGETLASITRQTWQNLEIIVVDDGSTDATPALVRQAGGRVRYFRQDKNSGGCSVPRNVGLAQARGAYVNFFDADDIMAPEKIAGQMATFRQYPAAGMVIGDFENFSGDHRYPSHFTTCSELCGHFARHGVGPGGAILFSPPQATELFLRENFGSACSPLYRTELVRQLGGFEEELSACEDFFLNYRLASRAPTVVLNTPGFRRRLHDASMSANFPRMIGNYIRSREKLLRLETSPLNARLLKNRLATYHLDAAMHVSPENDRGRRLRQALKSLRYFPAFDRQQWLIFCKVTAKAAFF